MTTTECKYYRDKDKECDVWGIPCEMKDCYFKELSRLEQENEKLKKTLQEIKEIINTCLEFKTCEKCKFYKACNRDLEGCILTLIKKAEEE